MLNCAGRFVPLVTPFTDDGSGVSEVRLSRLIRMHRENGIEGFVVATEVGEFAQLGNSERKQLLEWAIRDSQNAPVLVHVSTLVTYTTLDLAQHAERHGARGVIVMPPFYGRFSDEELIGHFRTVNHYCELPVLVVDPFRILGPAVRESLGALPQIGFVGDSPADWEGRLGKSAARTEEFVFDKVEVSPLFGCPAPEDLRTLAAEQGRTRVLKALFEEAGMEVGPPRAPMQPLRVHALEQARQKAA